MMNKKTRLITLSLAVFMLVGCSGVMDSKRDARQTYLLAPDASISGAPAPASAPPLAVAISVVPGLDTDRILALSPDARLSPYANARWPDHLPEVIASVMKRSLSASGQFSAVKASSRRDDDGWLLSLEVQQFYGIQAGSGETTSVRVALAGTIECNGSISPITASDSNSVGEDRLSSVVAAHQRGLNEVTRQVLQQLGDSCP